MNDSHFIYAELLSSIVRFNSFSTILYFGPEDAREHCQLKHWVEWTGNAIPWLIWRSEATLKLSQFINAELLVLACLPRIYRRDLLNTVTQSLQHLRQAKVLIELASEEDVGLVSRVLLFCRQNEMLNVAAIFTNFRETQSIYSYAAYPQFELRKERFEKQFYNLYPEQSLDLKGFRLRTQPDLSEPNSILSFDDRGQPRFFGYVWNMVEEYARKHNAQLQLSYIPEQDKPLSHIQVLDMARDGYVDIAASVQPVTMRYIERYHEYAYPVHMGSWCTMLPKEPLIGVRDSYAWLMPVETICLLCVLWLIYESLRGRWQRHRRLLSIGWWLLAVLLATNVLGRLVSLIVAPPSKPPIDSFAALDKSKLRVFGLRSEYNAYDFDMRTQYSAIFQLSDKMSELIVLRNSLNTSFAYTVTHTKWLLYEEQQSHSTRPLFYFSQDLCYYQFIPFALVIPENSPHRAALDHLMLQFGQSGLYAHWTAKSFHYMVQAGRLHMRNFSDPHVIRPLKIRDVHHVLFFYAICVLISLTLFACELIRYRLKRSWMDI